MMQLYLQHRVVKFLGYILFSIGWVLVNIQIAHADPIPAIPTPSLPNLTLPEFTPPTPAPTIAPTTPSDTTHTGEGFEVDTSNVKPLPREHPAIEPALPKNVLPVPVKHQPPTPAQPTLPALPTLPSLPNLPNLPSLPTTPATGTAEITLPKEAAPQPGSMEDILDKEEKEEAKENYKERIYREQEQRAARIARRLRETHRTNRISTHLLEPHDEQNAQLPTYLTKEMLLKEVFKAIEDQDLGSLRTLLERAGTTEMMHGPSQETPLIYATKLQQFDTAHLLLWLRASVNQTDNTGHTALYYALRMQNKNISHLLLANGADINLVGPKDLSLFWIALHAFSEKDLEELRAFRHANHEIFDEATLMAVKSRNPQILNTLLKHGANPNLTDDKGDTLLTLAIRYEMADIASILQQYGAIEHTHGTYYVDLDEEGTQLDAATISHHIGKPYPLFTPE